MHARTKNSLKVDLQALMMASEDHKAEEAPMPMATQADLDPILSVDFDADLKELAEAEGLQFGSQGAAAPAEEEAQPKEAAATEDSPAAEDAAAAEQPEAEGEEEVAEGQEEADAASPAAEGEEAAAAEGADLVMTEEPQAEAAAVTEDGAIAVPEVVEAATEEQAAKADSQPSAAPAAAAAKPAVPAPKRKGLNMMVTKPEAEKAKDGGATQAAPAKPAVPAKKKLVIASSAPAATNEDAAAPAPAKPAAAKPAAATKPAATSSAAPAVAKKPKLAVAAAAPPKKAEGEAEGQEEGGEDAPAASAAKPAPKAGPKAEKTDKPAIKKKVLVAAPAGTSNGSAPALPKEAKPPKEGKQGKENKGPRAKSAFDFFTAEMRPKVKEENPDIAKDFLAVNKKLGEMWRVLGEEGRQPYNEKSAADKAVIKALKAVEAADNPRPPKEKKAPKAASAAVPKKLLMAAPPTAFGIFRSLKRAQYKAEDPSISSEELARMVQQEWDNMGEEDKEFYNQQAKESRAQQVASAPTQGEDLGLGVGMELDGEAGAPEGGVYAESDGEEGAPGSKKGSKGSAAGGMTKRQRGGLKQGRKGSRKGKRSKKGRGSEDEAEEGTEQQQQEEEEEDHEDEVTEEPDFILAHDYRGKYWVKLRSNSNFYSFIFVSKERVKALRNNPPAEGADDGFNGWGQRLLELVDEYERDVRKFDADAHECMDADGGLNFDLMPDGSLLDVCAVLGAMRDRDAGGLLSAKPRRKGSAVRGLDDLMINVPALMLSMLTQRMVCMWRGRALRAEAQLAAASAMEELAA